MQLKCDLCDKVKREKNPQFLGWGKLLGAIVEGTKREGITFCPEHLKEVLTILNTILDKNESN